MAGRLTAMLAGMGLEHKPQQFCECDDHPPAREKEFCRCHESPPQPLDDLWPWDFHRFAEQQARKGLRRPSALGKPRSHTAAPPRREARSLRQLFTEADEGGSANVVEAVVAAPVAVATEAVAAAAAAPAVVAEVVAAAVAAPAAAASS